MYRQQIPLQPRKPVETGCFEVNGTVIPADAMLYYQAIEKSIPLKTLCPYRFKLAASPPVAAKQEGREITLDALEKACEVDINSYLLVEGAGGFYSPIADDGLNADLAERLDLEVLVVAANRLGVINQTLLTVEAIERRGLTVSAIILNQLENSNLPFDNAASLKELVKYPVHKVSFNTTDSNLETLFKNHLT